ncbi:MAG: leucine-rich repeat protein [Clostridia bacterium]|nr:leucine-rich repeat protein [Clostridia bacterium]
MKFKRFMGLVLAVLMVISTFTVGTFAATQDLQETKKTTLVYGTPVIDGQLDAVWENAFTVDFPYDRNNSKVVDGVLTVPAEKVTVDHWAKAMWDESHIYAYFRVYDSTVVTNVSDQIHLNDSVELYIDEYNDKGLAKTDCARFYQVSISADGKAVSPDEDWGDYKTTINAEKGYYDVEIALDVTTRTLANDAEIGIDFAINCNDKVGEAVREHSLSWNDQTNIAYKSPVYLGEATLTGMTGESTIVDPTDHELPADAELKEENWVQNTALRNTQIKWQVYDQGDDQVLKFTYWPKEADNIKGSILYAVGVNDTVEKTYKKIVGWDGGHDTAWGKYETTITKVIVGDGITEIKGGFIEGFPAVMTVEIPESLTTLSAGQTFSAASKLRSVYVKGTEVISGQVDLSNITSIEGSRTFDSSKKISKIILSENLTGELKVEIFKATQITEISIPAGVTSIAAEAFDACSALTKVVINGMETTISQYAFASSSTAEATNYKDNVTIYCYSGSAAEANAKEYGFKYEYLDEGYTVAYDANGGSDAPAEQNKLKDVELTLSSDVPTYEGFTFKGWATSADGEVAYEAGAAYTANENVTLYAVWELAIDTASRELPTDATIVDEGGWVPNSDLEETQIKWQVYTQGEDTVLKFTYWPEETDKVATSTICGVNAETGKGIGWGNGELFAWGAYESTATKVIIGDGITATSGSGFLMTFNKVKTIEIPDDLKTLGGASFEGCSSLTSVYYAGNTAVDGVADLSSVTSIGDYCFDACKKITSVKLSPDYTGKIGQETFKECGITEIEIPAGVTAVDTEAFALCYSLSKVVVNGMTTTIHADAFKSIDGTEVKVDNTSNVTIYGYEGSAAQANAAEYNFTFELLNDGGDDPVVPPATYTVAYDANGGTGAPEAQTKTENVELTLSTAVPTYTGYTFKGWSTSADGEVEYAAGAAYTANANVTLYAVWEATVVDENIVTGNVVSDYSNNLWSFNRTTKVLTITCNTTANYNESGSYNEDGGWKDILTEIEEIVLIGNIDKITNHAFDGATNLRKVTMPKDVVQIDPWSFAGCSKLETICVEGSPVMEGVLDFSNIMGANAKGNSSFAKADVFSGDTVATAIILSSRYSDVPSVEGDASSAPTLNMDYLPSNLKTIYGATEYLETFAAANNLEFVPFGKSTDKNIYWTLDEATGTLTLIGEGTLKGLDSAITEYAASVKNVVIPATITEIADDALAALTALESATFEGNAPTVAEGAEPFGTQSVDFVINVKANAEGFDDETWCGYTVVRATIVPGDVNGDGEVTSKDAVLLAQYLAKWKVELDLTAANVNGDKVVDSKDAVLLAQYLAKWKVTLIGPPSFGDIEIESDRVV